MKRILTFLFILITTISFGANARATFFPDPPAEQVASHEYLLTTKLDKSGGVVTLATGSSSNLSLRFMGDEDTGIYSHAANSIAFITGGNMLLRLHDGNQIQPWYSMVFAATNNPVLIMNSGLPGSAMLNSGTASSTRPSFTFAANTNTGLGCHSTGQPSMVASGVEAMRFTNNGILIATGSSTNLALRFFGDEDTGIVSEGANQFQFYAGGANRFWFQSSGTYFSQSYNIMTDANSTGSFVIVPYATGKANYTWKSEGSGLYNQGLGCTSATDTQPSMWSYNGTANPTKAQTWGSESTTLNVPIIIATGSSSNLALRFLGDEDTGIYSSSANTLVITAGGSNVMSFLSGSVYSYRDMLGVGNLGARVKFSANGNTTTPTFMPSGIITNSGLGGVDYQPSMIASGVEAMRWSSTETDINTVVKLAGVATPTAATGILFRNSTDNHPLLLL